MPWKKGESGNKAGRPEKSFAEQVRIVCAEQDKVRKCRKLRALAEKLYEEAMKGEGWAMCQIADRLDGKPATIVGGDADAPIIHRIEVEFVGSGHAE